MADKTTKETKRNTENEIPFFDEKKWIMAYWFKRNRKTEYTEKYLFKQWSKWWAGDFDNDSDERLHDIVVWIKEIARAMSKDEVKQKRREIADAKPMPQYIQKLAAKKGYYVKKCSTRNYPLKVSGYAIFKNKKDKVAVYGKRFDLTVKQVRKILKTKEDK